MQAPVAAHDTTDLAPGLPPGLLRWHSLRVFPHERPACLPFIMFQEWQPGLYSPTSMPAGSQCPTTAHFWLQLVLDNWSTCPKLGHPGFKVQQQLRVSLSKGISNYCTEIMYTPRHCLYLDMLQSFRGSGGRPGSTNSVPQLAYSNFNGAHSQSAGRCPTDRTLPDISHHR